MRPVGCVGRLKYVLILPGYLDQKKGSILAQNFGAFNVTNSNRYQIIAGFQPALSSKRGPKYRVSWAINCLLETGCWMALCFSRINLNTEAVLNMIWPRVYGTKPGRNLTVPPRSFLPAFQSILSSILRASTARSRARHF